MPQTCPSFPFTPALQLLRSNVYRLGSDKPLAVSKQLPDCTTVFKNACYAFSIYKALQGLHFYCDWARESMSLGKSSCYCDFKRTMVLGWEKRLYHEGWRVSRRVAGQCFFPAESRRGGEKRCVHRWGRGALQALTHTTPASAPPERHPPKLSNVLLHTRHTRVPSRPWL